MIRVSVCIPTYNQALFLEKAIKSAAAQSLAPHEIIVADDASTDETQEVLAKLKGQIPMLRVIRQPENVGISRNVDACLKSASGELVVRLDSDDMLLPYYIETLAALLKEYPQAGYAHAAVIEVDGHDRSIRKRRLLRQSGYQGDAEALTAAIHGYRVAANIIMFRRDALQTVGYIKNSADFAEDYYLCASIAAHGFGNCYVDAVLSKYRIWTDAGKIRQKRKLAEIIGLAKVFDEVLEPALSGHPMMQRKLRKKRTDFACRHSDCLGWNIYSSDEKEELAKALDLLSVAPKVRAVKWIYNNGFGKGLQAIHSLFCLPKMAAKRAFMWYRSKAVAPAQNTSL